MPLHPASIVLFPGLMDVIVPVIRESRNDGVDILLTQLIAKTRHPALAVPDDLPQFSQRVMPGVA